MKEIQTTKECVYCKEPIVSPLDMEFHFSCQALYNASKACEFDVKDIATIKNLLDDTK